MAEATKSFINGTDSSHYYTKLVFTENYVDEANNKSNITVSLYMRSNSGYYSFYGYYNEGRIWVDGAEKAHGTNTSAVNSSGDTFVCSWTGDVYHNNDGSKVISVRWGVYSAYAGSSDGDASWTLTKINRYPILNSASNFKDNENPVFNITAFGTYPIKVKLEAGGNSQLITRTLSNKNSQTYTLVLTDSERETLRNMMTGDSLNVRMTVCAVNNGTEISWSSKDVKMIKGSHYIKLRVNGVWKDAIPYIRVNNQWKEAIPYIRVNNQWKEGI